MQSSTFSSLQYPEHDNLESKETSPLISRSELGSKKVKSYTNTLPCSFKRRARLKTRIFKHTNITLNPGEDVEEPSISPHSSPSSQSHSTLAPSSDSRDPSPGWQQTCTSPQSEVTCSPSSSRRHRENFLSQLSLTLENQGSVARDHLASERTFLAYVRTSLAIASSGVALVQLFTVASANLKHYPEHRLHTYIRPLGAITIVMGLLVLIIGVIRYFSVQAALINGRFPAARVVTSFITAVLVIIVITTFGILVAGKLEPPKGRHSDILLH